MAKAGKTQSKAVGKRVPARRTPRKAAPRSRGFEPQDCRLEAPPAALAEAASRVEKEAGVVCGYLPRPSRWPAAVVRDPAN